MQPTPLFSENTVPLSLVVQRCEVQVGRWTTPRWELLGIVAGAHVKAETADGVDMQTSIGCTCHVWTDLEISLYKDAAESYWHNLLSEQPCLFVICRPDEQDELQPCVVTADQNEAAAYMEADDTVLTAPMPAEIYQWLEHFVVQYCQPQEQKKRQPKNWVKDTMHGKA